jgi:hypothetical protein
LHLDPNATVLILERQVAITPALDRSQIPLKRRTCQFEAQVFSISQDRAHLLVLVRLTIPNEVENYRQELAPRITT